MRHRGGLWTRWTAALALASLVGAGLGGGAAAMAGDAGSVMPPAPAAARSSVILPLPSSGDAFDARDVAIDGPHVLYVTRDSYSEAARRQRCYPIRQMRLLDLARHTDRLVDQVARPPGGGCAWYGAVQLSWPWVVAESGGQEARGQTRALTALNLLTGRRRVLSRAPHAEGRGGSGTFFAWSLSGPRVVWVANHYRDPVRGSASLELADLTSGRQRTVVRTPWSNWHDTQTPTARAVALAGDRLVWLRMVGNRGDVLLEDLSTGGVRVLAHDIGYRETLIAGGAVAWLDNHPNRSGGLVRVLDLRAGSMVPVTAEVADNLQLGDGLVGWSPMNWEDPRLYDLRRHTTYVYRGQPPSPAWGVVVSMVRLFGRQVLVATTLHWDCGGPIRRTLYRLDTY